MGNPFEKAINKPKQEKGKVVPKPSQFSANLSGEVQRTFDDIHVALKKLSGLSISKADILRVWINLTADDPTLMNQMAEDLKNK